MPRYRLTVEYDGTPYVGWQRQDNGPSVQGHLEGAVHRLTGESVIVTGAGRTDAGVHALGQVAHFDLEREWGPFRLMEALNFHLKPEAIALVDCQTAKPDFHARFSATGRHYRYLIANRRAPLTVDRDRQLEVTRELDTEAMHEAAQILVGRHDFTSFRASLCQAKSPVKTLSRLSVFRQMRDVIAIEASAPSFLHHQVRNIVGSLLLVGTGKWGAADLQEALNARDRAAAGPTAPAHGLYLIAVDYSDRIVD
jgi:tRNA pseudouridine38-40 synthase